MIIRTLIAFLLFCGSAYADVDALVRRFDGPGERRAGDIVSYHETGSTTDGFGKGSVFPEYSIVTFQSISVEDFKPWGKRHFEYEPGKSVRSHYRLDKYLLDPTDIIEFDKGKLKKTHDELKNKLKDRTSKLEIRDAIRISRHIEQKNRWQAWLYDALSPRKAWAATTTFTKIVDPDGVGSPARDYASLDAWEDALGGTTSGNLVTQDEIAIAQCRNSSGGADTTAVVIAGWTTGANNYILIESYTGYRHAGVWDESKYWMHNNDANEYQITIYEDYVRIDGIQCKVTATSTNVRTAFNVASVGVSNEIRFMNNIIQGICSGTGEANGLRIGVSSAISYAVNNVIYDFISTDNPSDSNFRGIYADSFTNLYLYNNTVYNCYVGIDNDNKAGVYKNNIVFGNTDDFLNTTNATIDYNASDDGDGTNAISPSGADWANEMPDYATSDFTLVSTGNCYQAGVNDPSGSDYGDPSINNVARPTAPTLWSVGAFEVSGTPAATAPNAATIISTF